MMTQDWFVGIGGVVEGPLSMEHLKKDARLTPDMLVWRSGFDEWRSIGDVPEFSDLFNEVKASKNEKKKPPVEEPLAEEPLVEEPFVEEPLAEESENPEDKEVANFEEPEPELESELESDGDENQDDDFLADGDEMVLELQEEPPIFKFWLIVLLLGITYIFYHFYFII